MKLNYLDYKKNCLIFSKPASKYVRYPNKSSSYEVLLYNSRSYTLLHAFEPVYRKDTLSRNSSCTMIHNLTVNGLCVLLSAALMVMNSVTLQAAKFNARTALFTFMWSVKFVSAIFFFHHFSTVHTV